MNEQFDILADRYLRNELSDSDMESLAVLVEEDVSLVDRLKDQLLIDGLLRQSAGMELATGKELSGRGTPLVEGSTKRRGVRSFRFFLKRPVLYTAGLLFLALTASLISLSYCELLPNLPGADRLSGRLVHAYTHAYSPATQETLVCNAVATITRLDNVVWNEGSPVYSPGEIISPGWVRLQSGTVWLEFFSGAQVCLQGSTDFLAVTSELGYCSRGNLSARVPPQATGFTIDVPQMTVIDRGTEFTLNVTGDCSQVHVLKGEVELDQTPVGLKQLKEGEGMAVTTDGHVQTLSFRDQTKLMSFERGPFISQEEIDACRVRRNKVFEEFDRDARSLLHFDMKPCNGSRITNRALEGRKQTGDGTRVRCEWGPGSLPDTGALEFRRVSDRLRVLVPEELESFSLFTRIRLDSLDRETCSLLTSDEIRCSGLSWQIYRESAATGPSLQLNLFDPACGQICQYEAAFPLTVNDLGQWFTLATIVDREKGTVRHYYNGTLLLEQPIAHTAPVKIGLAELGNAADTRYDGVYRVRTLGGAMDDFLLSSAPLTVNQLENLN